MTWQLEIWQISFGHFNSPSMAKSFRNWKIKRRSTELNVAVGTSCSFHNASADNIGGDIIVNRTCWLTEWSQFSQCALPAVTVHDSEGALESRWSHIICLHKTHLYNSCERMTKIFAMLVKLHHLETISSVWQLVPAWLYGMLIIFSFVHRRLV